MKISEVTKMLSNSWARSRAGDVCYSPLGGRRIKKRYAIPFFYAIYLMFVIPHDPSTTLDPWKVGSAAWSVARGPARLLRRAVAPRTSGPRTVDA